MGGNTRASSGSRRVIHSARGATMDENQKGCLCVGGVFFFMGICGMVVLITSLAVILRTPSAPSQHARAGSDPLAAFNILLFLIEELIKYVMTPFVPVLNLFAPTRP